MQQLQRRYCTEAADQIGKHDVTGVKAAVDDSPILKIGDHYHSAQKVAMSEEGIEISKGVWRGIMTDTWYACDFTRRRPRA